MLSGAIAVETIFSWPGLGLATYEALKGPDLPMLQGLFLVFSAAVIVVNLVADLLYGYLDPRVRHGMSDRRGRDEVTSARRIAWLRRRRAFGRRVARVPPAPARDDRPRDPGAGRG